MQIGSFLDTSSYTSLNTPSPSLVTSEKKSTKKPDSTELTAADKALISQLQARDTVVREHERAHIAAGAGVILGGATFTYQKAPDEKLYAIGGEVTIDTAPESKPEATIRKMQTVQACALAPRDPSATDYQVAATASMLQMKARLEMARAMQNELLEKGKEAYQANTIEPQSSFSKYA